MPELAWDAFVLVVAAVWHAHPLLVVPPLLLAACPLFTSRDRRALRFSWQAQVDPRPSQLPGYAPAVDLDGLDQRGPYGAPLHPLHPVTGDAVVVDAAPVYVADDVDRRAA